MATTVERAPGAVRFSALKTLVSWLTTVDHKRIGIMYAVASLIFFVLGGLEALVIRTQLALPDQRLVDPDTFNQLFTMHGTTMVFLAIMPLNAAFFNYLIPLMIGARDVAFPKLNAFSFWMFLFGGIFLNTSWFLGGAPDAGWFGYANLTSLEYSRGLGVDYWGLGLQLLGIGTMVSAFNFIVTILNLRTKGMSLMRMPVFSWNTLITSFLIIMAFPAITVALFLLMFDRFFGTNFFNVAAGGDVVLWQHLFWIFGHPEVYILILPAMGIVSEVLPTAARKPLFGYPIVVFSSVLIGFLGFGVWIHHMFTVGLGPVVNSIFALTTLTIAIPTGVKIFNWIATLWGGSIRFTTSLLFSVGFIWMFVIGGLSGVMHAMSPADAQQHDSYFVVAHFHYVLIGGALFAIVSGFYHWFPKVTGRFLSERLGKVSFWLMFIGFNLTFFPMHFLGLMGMPRRVFTYTADMGITLWNFVATVGAFILGVGVLVFLMNLIRSLRHGEEAGADPWDGRTLEWSLPSPVPAYNFARLPVVRSREPVWTDKHPEFLSEQGPAPEPDPDPHVQDGKVLMPAPSFYPILVSLFLTIAAYGLMYNRIALIAGLAAALFGFYGWAVEGSGEVRYDIEEPDEEPLSLDAAGEGESS